MNYLYHGGVIGDAKNLEVDLSLDRLEQYSFTNKKFDKKEALKTSYSFLDVANYSITMPMLSTTYLAPLKTEFNANGLSADYILWAQGESGTRKSSLTAVNLSHYGRFQRNTFPCSFCDTANSMEKKAFVLKDSLNVIDDFAPEAVGNKKTMVAEKAFGIYGDGAGRDRMCGDSRTLKGAYTARGLCIITGETFPKVSQSRLARTILVNIKQGDIDLKKLRYLQNNTEMLSYSMKEYIQWFIDNEKVIIQKAKEQYLLLEEKFLKDDVHGRTCEAIILMMIGFGLFLDFLYEAGVITITEKEEKEKISEEVFLELEKTQNEEINSDNPIIMFVEAINQLEANEKIKIVNYNIDYIPNAITNVVGYRDQINRQCYLLPDVSYKEVVKFYKEQGIKFPVSKRTLIKMLYDEGYLYVTEKSDRKTVKRRLPNTTTVVPVLAIYEEKMELDCTFENVSEVQRMQEELKKVL